MRDIIDLLEGENLPRRGLKPLGEMSAKVFWMPTHNDMVTLLQKSRIGDLRGGAMNVNGTWVYAIWPARNLGHWNFFNECFAREGLHYSEYISFRICRNEATLMEERYWQYSQRYHCGDFFVSFVPDYGLSTVQSDPGMSRLFGPLKSVEKQKLAESFGNVIDFGSDDNDLLWDLQTAARSNTLTEKNRREFASYLNGHKNDFIRMYHATHAMHDIATQGLKATGARTAKSLQSQHGYVYLSAYPKYALRFAEMAYSGTPGDLVVYSVDVTVRRLLPDHDQLFNKRMWGDNPDIGSTLADSLIYGNGARVKGRIEPYQITVWGRFDKRGNRLD